MTEIGVLVLQNVWRIQLSCCCDVLVNKASPRCHQLQCCMPINVAENCKMVTTNFGPEVEMLLFLRIRTKK